MGDEYFHAEWNDLICEKTLFYLCEKVTICQVG